MCLKFQTFIGVPYELGLENLQILSLFCSSAIMLLSVKFFRMFKLKGLLLYIATAIIAFHPTFILLAGSINNDILSILLTLLSVVLALKWYRKPKLKTIILLAFSIAFSMLVKLSAGLVSIGIAVLFAIRFFKSKGQDKKKLICQFLIFAVICIPLGLSYQVRNMIKFDVPLAYVKKMPLSSYQYIGWRNTSERLFDFSSIWEAGVYQARTISTQPMYEYCEYNILTAMLKSSVFGIWYPGKGSTILEPFAHILFWSAALLAIISFICMLYVVIKAIKNKIKKKENENKISELLYPFICWLTIMITYINFCFEFPHLSSMDFRYIAIMPVFGALYIGILLKNSFKNNKKYSKVLIVTIILLVCLMSISSIALYTTRGAKLV